VTTELGTGTSYLVQDGISGYVVPPRQPEALARALNRLLAEGNERRQMGISGQKRVQQSFTPEKMVSSVTAVYEQVLRAHLLSLFQ
jgi:glycosyltransferase involved in cell wall biosynthesis